MRHFKLNKTIIALSVFTCGMAGAIEINQNGQNIILDSLENSAYHLKISMPNGEVKDFDINDGYISLSPGLLGVKSLQNGRYKYELTPVFPSSEIESQVRMLDDEKVSNDYVNSVTKSVEPVSGTFSLVDNVLVTGLSDINTKNDADGNNKDNVILDDLIVDGSGCIGFDCVNGESFGFDTLRLKENNLRIHFDDTSNSSSFPANDWRIVANDTSNGGSNYLAIEDSTAGRIPFRVEAGARANALVVEADGDVGIGTLNPAVDLQIVNGNTPTLRLEQDGSSGFTAQTWDVAGNEANFFVRDVTHSSSLPFRIRPGAPESSIDIAADGDVGMGTGSPQAKLHVVTTDDAGKMLLENTNSTQKDRDILHLINNGKPQIKLENSANGKYWIISAGNRLVIKNPQGTGIMDVDENGNIRIAGTVTENFTF